jgi:ABC-2 type transport system ATP-binding protein
MALLAFENVDKTYAGAPALREVDLHLDEGESLGLIGLNGAGKTTLIKCLLDLQRCDRGRITVNGRPGTQPRAREELMYLPEKFAPPDYMTGRWYLRYVNDAHRRARVSEADLNRRAGELCETLELDAGALDRSVRTYSKGMLQKVGLIGCLLSDKPLLVLDEPMSGLDPKARVLFREAMQGLKSAGRTVLLCTHILTDIEALCDRVGILHRGELLFTGTPQGCCRHYQAEGLEVAFLESIQ